ncbi:MAG: UDP-2,4-diacetamido-2,4,6-trideoxy-beta-L-altropyranose hydrolase [Gammaproteobacteria bacterium]|nr:UDP-2,4-diacetamido-2,4,6-trideoxy-beta-L-altropyranose hydrolase [Gammaproteobacteria bacterium]
MSFEPTSEKTSTFQMSSSQLKRKALFRLDSGGQYGLGHVMRSKALADALLKINIECTFAVQSVHSNDAVLPHNLININTENDFHSLAKAYDVIIVDHYDYTTELFFQLSKIDHTVLVVLDDECNRGKLYADIVINPAAQAASLPYAETCPEAKWLFGFDYILLRSFFKELESQYDEYSYYEKRQSIVITFGGSDVTGLTLPLLKSIKNTSLMSFDIIVVTGVGCQNSDEIETYCSELKMSYKHNVKNMAQLFLKAKLAISAAGSTAFELAYCGVPSIFAVVADNQLISIEDQCRQGWCQMVDCRKQNNVSDIIYYAEKLINSTQLKELSQLAQSLVDGKGAERIAQCIKSEISNQK